MTSTGKDSKVVDTDQGTIGKKSENDGNTDVNVAAAEANVNTHPTEGQKAAGNYKMGHVKVDGYDVTIENPKGSERSGNVGKSNEWHVTMNNTYGYIRGTEGVDGDHIDIFLSDDPLRGDVFVVDQVKKDGTFDEHKVMYGFGSEEEARKAYLSNYSPGWKGLGNITQVSKEDFKKWVDSSHRKTKPFAEYKMVHMKAAAPAEAEPRPLVEDGSVLKNNLARGDAVAGVVGSEMDGGKCVYLVRYATDAEDLEAGLVLGGKYIPEEELQHMLESGQLSKMEEKPVIKPNNYYVSEDGAAFKVLSVSDGKVKGIVFDMNDESVEPIEVERSVEDFENHIGADIQDITNDLNEITEALHVGEALKHYFGMLAKHHEVSNDMKDNMVEEQQKHSQPTMELIVSDRFEPTRKLAPVRRNLMYGYVEREKGRARKRVQELADKMGVKVQFVEDVNELEEDAKHAKGWYNIKDKEIVVVIPNNVNADDCVMNMLTK